MFESETNSIVGDNEPERPPQELEELNFGNQGEQQEDPFRQDLGYSNSKNSAGNMTNKSSKSSLSTEVPDFMEIEKKLQNALEDDEGEIQETQPFDSSSKGSKLELSPLEKYENSRNLNKKIWDRSFKNKWFHTQVNKLFKKRAFSLDFDSLYHIPDRFTYANLFEPFFEKFLKSGDFSHKAEFLNFVYGQTRGNYLIFVILQVLSGLLRIPIPLFTQWFVDCLLDPTNPDSALNGLYAALLIAGSTVLSQAVEICSDHYQKQVFLDIRIHLIVRIEKCFHNNSLLNDENRLQNS